MVHRWFGMPNAWGPFSSLKNTVSNPWFLRFHRLKVKQYSQLVQNHNYCGHFYESRYSKQSNPTNYLIGLPIHSGFGSHSSHKTFGLFLNFVRIFLSESFHDLLVHIGAIIFVFHLGHVPFVAFLMKFFFSNMWYCLVWYLMICDRVGPIFYMPHLHSMSYMKFIEV